MTKISSVEYAAVGAALLGRVNSGTVIPYVAGGMSLSGMDCQGLCEYLLMQCGVPASECDLKGSNAHWRECVWTGTPEECAAKFGRVPVGAWVFIVSDDGGEIARGYNDGLGNAEHMGVVLDGCAIHASSSRGCVAESSFGGKTIPNGGWNGIGLPKWVDYGDKVNAVLAGIELDGSDGSTGGSSGGSGGSDEGLTAGSPADGSVVDGDELTGGTAAAVRWATVASPDGNPVKLRKTASRKEPVYWKVNDGARVKVEKIKGGWALIVAICTDGYTRRAYMMGEFLDW